MVIAVRGSRRGLRHSSSFFAFVVRCVDSLGYSFALTPRRTSRCLRSLCSSVVTCTSRMSSSFFRLAPENSSERRCEISKICSVDSCGRFCLWVAVEESSSAPPTPSADATSFGSMPSITMLLRLAIICANESRPDASRLRQVDGRLPFSASTPSSEKRSGGGSFLPASSEWNSPSVQSSPPPARPVSAPRDSASTVRSGPATMRWNLLHSCVSASLG
mmetsp:Transcript_26675/g.87463  ORF Transcript_26675/g.87463 Transcript_26675/m.87463 type:complete len:218 (-) Transcript_26675:1088-1741(-)